MEVDFRRHRCGCTVLNLRSMLIPTLYNHAAGAPASTRMLSRHCTRAGATASTTCTDSSSFFNIFMNNSITNSQAFVSQVLLTSGLDEDAVRAMRSGTGHGGDHLHRLKVKDS